MAVIINCVQLILPSLLGEAHFTRIDGEKLYLRDYVWTTPTSLTLMLWHISHRSFVWRNTLLSVSHILLFYPGYTATWDAVFLHFNSSIPTYTSINDSLTKALRFYLDNIISFLPQTHIIWSNHLTITNRSFIPHTLPCPSFLCSTVYFFA